MALVYWSRSKTEPSPVAPRLPAPERRASIIAAARDLFAQKGLHGVSVDEIAAAVGVSPAVLYRHFDSKQDLYTAVIEELAGQREDYVRVVVEGGDDFPGVLLGLTRVFVRGIVRQPALLRMVWA